MMRRGEAAAEGLSGAAVGEGLLILTKGLPAGAGCCYF
jgi:hypothetical protein